MTSGAFTDIIGEERTDGGVAVDDATEAAGSDAETDEVYYPAIAPMPDRDYRTILADPPWSYDDPLTGNGRGAEEHYETLSVEQIQALGGMVNSVADAHAHLYLWTTNGFLDPAFDVVESWGFTPKTVLTWVKAYDAPETLPHEREEQPSINSYMGMGRYYRNSTEHCIFATKANYSVNHNDCYTHFFGEVGEHSEKPAKFYRLVEHQSDGPYLEMFARNEREGWDSWGKEA